MLEKILRIVALTGVIIMSLTVALNYSLDILDRTVLVPPEQIATPVAEDYISECVSHNAPHVLMVDGEPYCYMIFQGTEYMKPLSELQDK